MKKQRKNGLAKGFKVFLVLLAVLGVGTAVTAILTKGFKEWGVAERAIKGGTVVDKFTVDNLSHDEAQFIDAEDFKLNLAFEGSLKEEKAILGDKTEEAAFAKEDLENGLEHYGVSDKEIEAIVEYVIEDDLCKASYLNLQFNVEFNEEEATKSMKKLPWFDTVRINYKIPAERMIITLNGNEEQNIQSHAKRINTITSLHEDIALLPLEEDATLSENNIDFMTIAKAGEVDNTLEIQSIELLRMSNKHQNDYCWIYQA